MLAQIRKLIHHFFHARPHTALVARCNSAQFEIVPDGKLRDHVAPLRDISDAMLDHLGRRLACDIVPVEQDLAGMNGQKPENRLENSGLAGSVRPDDGRD